MSPGLGTLKDQIITITKESDAFTHYHLIGTVFHFIFVDQIKF